VNGFVDYLNCGSLPHHRYFQVEHDVEEHEEQEDDEEDVDEDSPEKEEGDHSIFPLNKDGTLSALAHLHFGQTTSASSSRLKTRTSKIFPHRLHLYSYMGITTSSNLNLFLFKQLTLREISPNVKNHCFIRRFIHRKFRI